MIEPGKLNRRIVLKQPDVKIGEDPFRNPIYGVKEHLRSAEYLPVSDRERVMAKEVAAEYTARFRLQWTPTVAQVTPRWWLTFDGRDYDIIGTKELGRRQGIEITASARTDLWGGSTNAEYGQD